MARSSHLFVVVRTLIRTNVKIITWKIFKAKLVEFNYYIQITMLFLNLKYSIFTSRYHLKLVVNLIFPHKYSPNNQLLNSELVSKLVTVIKHN